MLDAHQLNIFVIAAETLNFSETARQLHMTQPSVSQHMQSLEQRLDVQLFHRAGRHLSLTEIGEALLPMARELVRQSITIEETMASLKGEVFGHLRLACSHAAGRYILPKLLSGFREKYPEVRISCRILESEAALGELVEGDVQFALTHLPSQASSVEFKKFMDDPIYLVVPPDHVWVNETSIGVEALLEGKFIVQGEASETARRVELSLPEIGLHADQLDMVLILGDCQAVANSVKEGLGVAFLSRLLADGPMRRGELARVWVEGLEPFLEIWIGRKIRQPPSRAQRAFWNFVHDPEKEWADILWPSE